MKDVPEAIDRWEKRYKTYRTKVGRELDDMTRQNILLQLLPVKYEERMRFNMHSRDRETVYSTLRHEIIDIAINVAGPMAVGMDLDSFDNPKDWYEQLPAELKAQFSHQDRQQDEDQDDEDETDDEDLDALRKGGGKKGGGKKGGGKTGEGRAKGAAKGAGRDVCPI